MRYTLLLDIETANLPFTSKKTSLSLGQGPPNNAIERFVQTENDGRSVKGMKEARRDDAFAFPSSDSGAHQRFSIPSLRLWLNPSKGYPSLAMSSCRSSPFCTTNGNRTMHQFRPSDFGTISQCFCSVATRRGIQ